MVLAIAYLLVTLVPIHGALYLGIRNERIRNRKILMSMWKLHKGGRR